MEGRYSRRDSTKPSTLDNRTSVSRHGRSGSRHGRSGSGHVRSGSWMSLVTKDRDISSSDDNMSDSDTYPVPGLVDYGTDNFQSVTDTVVDGGTGSRERSFSTSQLLRRGDSIPPRGVPPSKWQIERALKKNSDFNSKS